MEPNVCVEGSPGRPRNDEYMMNNFLGVFSINHFWHWILQFIGLVESKWNLRSPLLGINNALYLVRILLSDFPHSLSLSMNKALRKTPSNTLFTLDICIYVCVNATIKVYHCISGDANARAENGYERSLWVNVCIAIDTVINSDLGANAFLKCEHPLKTRRFLLVKHSFFIIIALSSL